MPRPAAPTPGAQPASPSPESQFDRPLFQRPELWQALMQTGLGMMAGSSTPGATFASTLGQSAAGLGVPTYQQGRERAAMSDAMRGVEGGMERLATMDPERYLALQKYAADNDNLVVVGNALYDKDSGVWVMPPDADDDAEWPSADVELYAKALGHNDPDDMVAADWEAIRGAIQADEVATRAAGVGIQTTMGDKEYERVVDDAAGSSAVLADLQMMESLLDRGMETGGFAAMTLPLRQVVLPILGMDTTALSDQEVFQSISFRMSLAARQNMPGQLSDNDILFLQGMAPNLRNTEAGNRLLIAVMQRIELRKGQLADEADRYISENNGSTQGLRRHLSDWGQSIDILHNTDLQEQLDAIRGPGRRN
jgi:hypothetical protein